MGLLGPNCSELECWGNCLALGQGLVGGFVPDRSAVTAIVPLLCPVPVGSGRYHTRICINLANSFCSVLVTP